MDRLDPQISLWPRSLQLGVWLQAKGFSVKEQTPSFNLVDSTRPT